MPTVNLIYPLAWQFHQYAPWQFHQPRATPSSSSKSQSILGSDVDYHLETEDTVTKEDMERFVVSTRVGCPDICDHGFGKASGLATTDGVAKESAAKYGY